MELQNKNIYILGLGISNISLIKFLQKQKGNKIYIYDDYNKDAFVEGTTNIDSTKINWQNIDFIVSSPVIPIDHPTLQLAKKHNIAIYTDIELFINFIPLAKIIAITGTNGKSTTSSLITHILKQDHRKVFLGGNIGIPVFDLDICNQEKCFYVFELSSYQLAKMKNVFIDDAIILNITSDHIVFHKNIEDYILAKAKILESNKKDFQGIIILSDQETKNLFKKRQSNNILSASFDDKKADIFLSKKNKLYNNKNCANSQNILATYIIAKRYDISNLQESLKSFKPLIHRMELLGTFNGAEIYNDSKATNAESSLNAIKMLENNIIWIAGGVAKEGGIEIILPYLTQISKIFLLGESKKYFKNQLNDANYKNYCLISSLEEGLEKISKINNLKNYKILFSPAAASFDMWKNFMHRGDDFKKILKNHKSYEALL